MSKNLAVALRFLAQGIAVIPPANDGSKRPAFAWQRFQNELPTPDELLMWFKEGVDGIGVVTGAVSGNLEMLELEGRAVAQKMHIEIAEIANNSGLGSLWSRLNAGYVEVTPSGGLHWLYRVSDGKIGGNLKLACKPGENGGVDVWAETRSEGGFTITAPSAGGVHPSGGAWQLIGGSIESIPFITMAERTSLHQLFALFDGMPKREELSIAILEKHDAPLSAGDDYNARHTWPEILEPLGWKSVYAKGEAVVWRRPGKSDGISATTNHGGNDKFYVFSTSTQFEAHSSYNKFAVFAITTHAGNFQRAAADLRSQGYGSSNVLKDYNYAPLALEVSENGVASSNGTDLDYLTAQEIRLARARRNAKRIIDAEDIAASFTKPIYVNNLKDELELPVEEVEWAIKDIFPTGANVTLTAMYKAGKTTLINSLAGSLADGTKFLNYFNPPIHNGRIVIFNYEVSENQYRKWMRDVSIEHSEKITLVHLRGQRLPLIAGHVEDYVVSILREFDAQTWILDPFARAFTGCGDENSNADVGQFLDTLDVIKERAGVSNLVLPIHTGRAQEHGIERARGATRLDDWADVRWLLKKTQEGRFFSADGRDVLLEEQLLTYDDQKRSLTLGGADAWTTRKRSYEDQWVEIVEKNPGKSTTELSELLGKRVDDKGFKSARKSAIHNKRVHTVMVGRSDCWKPGPHLENYTPQEIGN